MTPGAVSSDDVTAARKLIHDVISDTPVLHSRVLSETVGGPVFPAGKCGKTAISAQLRRSCIWPFRVYMLRLKRLSPAFVRAGF